MTHGASPNYANIDQVNPGPVALSGETMLRYLGLTEAADLIIKGMDGAITAKTATYDFERLMRAEGDTGVTKVKCSRFADAMIRKMGQAPHHTYRIAAQNTSTGNRPRRQR